MIAVELALSVGVSNSPSNLLLSSRHPGVFVAQPDCRSHHNFYNIKHFQTLSYRKEKLISFSTSSIINVVSFLIMNICRYCVFADSNYRQSSYSASKPPAGVPRPNLPCSLVCLFVLINWDYSSVGAVVHWASETQRHSGATYTSRLAGLIPRSDQWGDNKAWPVWGHGILRRQHAPSHCCAQKLWTFRYYSLIHMKPLQYFDQSLSSGLISRPATYLAVRPPFGRFSKHLIILVGTYLG